MPLNDTQDAPEKQLDGNGLLPRMQWAHAAIQHFRLSAPQAAVLVNLAYHMHKDREEWAMSQETIGKETRLSPKTVSRAMGILIHRELVILKRSGKGNLSQATNHYSLSGFGTKWQIIDADTPEKVGTESPKTNEGQSDTVSRNGAESPETGQRVPLQSDSVSENGTESPNNLDSTKTVTKTSLLLSPPKRRREIWKKKKRRRGP